MDNFWSYVVKYFFISLIGTAVFVVVILQVPVLRRRIFSAMERLAAWHESGTQEVDVGSMRVGEVRKDDPFLLARAGERLEKR